MLLKLANVEDSDVGKAWLRKQAIELLGYVQLPNAISENASVLQSVLSDKKTPLTLRCIAAESLGQVNLANTGLKADSLVNALRQLMKDGCDAELKTVKEKDLAVSPRQMKAYLGAVMAGLGLGFGILISSLTTKYRDLRFLVGFGVQLLMYATPVIYPTSAVPEQFRWLILLNPMTPIVESFRFAYLGAGALDGWMLLYSLGFMAVVLIAL